jgi:hypothetical protein
MSMYSDHIAYAKKVRIPLRLSKIWCDNQLRLAKEMEHASICPKCGKPTLILESGSYEENTRDYVYCENYEIPETEDGEEYMTDCDYVTEPQKEHEPLSHWYDFDTIWAYSGGMIERKEMYPNLQEWLDFVRKEVASIQPKVSA